MHFDATRICVALVVAIVVAIVVTLCPPVGNRGRAGFAPGLLAAGGSIPVGAFLHSWLVTAQE
jgi:hypothetical protein